MQVEEIKKAAEKIGVKKRKKGRKKLHCKKLERKWKGYFFDC
jgi:uncharacterized protein YunC (DUF1805 family)